MNTEPKKSEGVNRREFLKKTGIAAAAAAFPHLWIPGPGFAGVHPKIDPGKPIKIGLLFSRTGVVSIVEKESYKVSLMAIEEVNNAGGIHGARLEPVVRDPGSNWSNYAKFAKELMKENVNIFWGCYTSASREALLPVTERGGAVLFYGTHYEGGECSPLYVATGAQPNQQIYDAIPWMMKKAGPKCYMVGSDYIFPRTMNKEGIFTLKKAGGKIVGEKYLDLSVVDEAGFKGMIADIVKKKPDFVLDNMVGDSIVAFRRAFKKAGLTRDNMPILACTLMENQIHQVGLEYCEGHYTSLPYFQTVQREENIAFVKKYKAFCASRPEWKEERVVTQGVMEGAYNAARVCIEAMKVANSAHPEAIVEAARGLEIKSPEADIKIDPENLHAWMIPRIGQVNGDGFFDIVKEAPELVRPMVFSPELSRGKECRDGGLTYRNNKMTPRRKSTRVIVPQ